MKFVKEESESIQSSSSSDLPPLTPPLELGALKLGEVGIDESEGTMKAACRRRDNRQLPTMTVVKNLCIEFAVSRYVDKKTPIKCCR